MPRSNKPFRDGKIHVQKKMCATCIFRPGNLMHLRPTRVAEMVEEAEEAQSAIICHDTLSGKQAICRGFFNKHKTMPLQVAERLGFIAEV